MKGFGFFKKCLLSLSLIVIFIIFLFTSTAGLYTGCWLLATILPGKLEVQHLQGRLLDTVTADKIIYQHDQTHIVIEKLTLNYALNLLGYDFKQQEMLSNPLIRGTIKVEQINVDHLGISQFRGSFSGNTLKTALAEGQFTGKYNELIFDGKLHYRKQLVLQLTSGNNNLTLRGQFPFPWKAQAFFKEPALLHPDLLGLETTIKVDAILQAAQQGKLTINLTKGHLNTKPIEGFTFLGADLHAEMKPQGIDSKGLLNIDKNKKFTFNLNFPQFKQWKGSGALYALDKTLFLKGQGNIQPQFDGKINLQGKDFPLIETSEYKIWLSPTLDAVFTKQSLMISGNILIPKAQITPLSFENGVVLSDDVTFDEPKQQSLPFNFSGDVILTMGEAVLLDIKGLHALLTGNINLNKTHQGSITATGQLNVKNGKYKAYGQDLAIEQGQLLFTGGLVTNPGIQVKAAKTFMNTTFVGANQKLDFNSNNRFGNKTTVGVEVTGWLNAPKIALFANPANLSQADILSMLILGHPASEASKSGAQLLLAAISSMNLGSGSKGVQLLEQLKNSLGVDFNVKNNTTYDQKNNSVKDSTGVEISKSLSKRLFVSYNRGLTSQADANVITLKYLLNKFFSVQVTASDSGNGIDLLYSSQKDEKNAKKSATP